MKVITHVAVKTPYLTWVLPAPNRHHNVLRAMFDLKVKRYYGQEVQGFLDDSGEFLNRRDAMKLASSNGQLKRDPNPSFYQGDELYSEDLW